MKKTLVSLLVIVLAAGLFVVTTHAESANDNFWINRPPMLNARSGLQIAVANEIIYVIGQSGTNEEYNPATLIWTTKQPVPTPRSSFGVGVIQNKIYVLGGNVGYDVSTDSPILCSLNEVYDPLTDTWESKKPIPTSRSQFSANVVNGKVYLIGGRTGGQYSTADLNEMYDPRTDSWTAKAPIPYPVVACSSAVVDGKIYIIGGQDEFADPMNLDLVQIYDPSTDTWSFGAPMKTLVWQAAAGATTGIWAPKRIYVFGGLPERSLYGTDTVQVYNTETDSWTLAASMPTPRYNLAVGVVNDTLYVLGGSSFVNFQGTAYAVNELYIPFGYEGLLPPYWSSPPSTSPSPTTSQTPSPSSTPKPTSSPSNKPSETPESQPPPLLTTLVATFIVATTVVIVLGLLVYFKKIPRKQEVMKKTALATAPENTRFGTGPGAYASNVISFGKIIIAGGSGTIN